MVLFLLQACSEEEAGHPQHDAWYYSIRNYQQEQFQEEYRLLLTRIEKKRQHIKRKYGSGDRKKVLNETRSYLYTVLSDSLFQFWYDTPWDFNGTSEQPGQGKIACGYFVTTTLKQAGFKIDRVWLAQQASSEIINTMCKREHIRIFSDGNKKGLKKYLNEQENSIFILGLDSHVGFLQKRDTVITMIHSSGFSPWKVVVEPFDACAAIYYSKFFMVGDLLRNDEALQKWISQSRFKSK